MEIAMCNLVLQPNWIIAKTFHYELLVKLALCINNLNFSLFKASNGFQASKITKIYDFFFIVVICLLTSLEHNPKISNPQVISKVV